MGEVYQARDLRLGRIVAIKVLPEQFASDPDRRRRFEREALAVAALNHPHICSLFDVGEAPMPASSISGPDSVRFLVMEHLDGQTLTERLVAGPLSLPEVLRYAVEIADALDHAHRQGLVHREELHERLWPDTFVSDATVTSLVAEVRTALEEKARRGRFVRTVHRFGYAFKGIATEAQPRLQSADGRARCWIVWKWGQVALTDGDEIRLGINQGDVPHVGNHRLHRDAAYRGRATTVGHVGHISGAAARSRS